MKNTVHNSKSAPDSDSESSLTSSSDSESSRSYDSDSESSTSALSASDDNESEYRDTPNENEIERINATFIRSLLTCDFKADRIEFYGKNKAHIRQISLENQNRILSAFEKTELSFSSDKIPYITTICNDFLKTPENEARIKSLLIKLNKAHVRHAGHQLTGIPAKLAKIRMNSAIPVIEQIRQIVNEMYQGYLMNYFEQARY